MSEPVPAELQVARRQFLELVGPVRPELHRYCARLTGSVVGGEDIVQEALARVFYEVSQSLEVPALRPLLFRVAHNAAIDFCRRYEQRHVEPVDSVPEALQVSEERDPEGVRAALARFVSLPLRQRSAVILKDVLGFTLEEIAQTTGMSVLAVKAALVRGREGLRQGAAQPEGAPVSLAPEELARLRRYAALFNARDWDGLRALLADECQLELVSQAKRQGRQVGGYFQRYAELPAVRLVPGLLEGRPALAVHDPADSERPAWFILLGWSAERVATIRDYRYASHIAAEAAFVPAYAPGMPGFSGPVAAREKRPHPFGGLSRLHLRTPNTRGTSEMKAFATKTSIRAQPETLWALLTDAAGYPQWNTTVDKVEGRIAPGEKVKVFAKLTPGRAFPVKVVTFEPNQRMVWSSGMPLGLFKGERTFTLTPKGAGEMEFSMREEFTGLLSPLITRSIPDLQPAFDEFAEALKRRAERG